VRFGSALLLILAAVVSAGNWNVGGRAGAVLQGGRFVPSVAITADYTVSDHLSWRTDFDATLVDANDLSRSTYQIPSNVLYHPVGSDAKFDPYLGPGVSLFSNGSGTFGAGANALAGFQIHPARQQAFGIEWRWGWPDLVHGTRTQLSVALVGKWETSF
jgi:hypothetical protein